MTVSAFTLRKNPRRGASMVETAFALPIALLFIFGIFEYGRYFMMRNVLADGAREGARFAVVHTNDMTTADVQNVVTTYLAGQQAQLQNFTIQVYLTDSSGNAIAGSDWTQASFDQGIGVQVDGDYQPVLPTYLFLPSMVHLRQVSIMSCEGN